MKKTVFLSILLLMSLASCKKETPPGWTLTVESDSTSIYSLHPTEKDGDMVRVWEIMNYTDKPYSFKVLSEYNCKKKMHRVLTITRFSEPMAKGNVVPIASPKSGEEDKWNYIAPESSGEITLKSACGQ